LRVIYKKVFYNACFGAQDFVSWVAVHLQISPQDTIEIALKMIHSSPPIIFAFDSKDNDFKLEKLYRFNNLQYVSLDPPPEPLIPEEIPEDAIKILDIHPLELARQLTLIEQEIYLRITCKELTELTKTKGILKDYKCPWIDRLYKRLDEIAPWVATEIVTSVNLNLRVEVIKRFIKIAEYCHTFQNYSTLNAILVGLKYPAVARLQKSWKLVGKKHKKTYKDLIFEVDPEIMMDKMRAMNPPFVPIIDTCINQIAKICEMPSNLEGELINFKKQRALGQLFEDMEKCKNAEKYPFRNIPRYTQYLLVERTILDEQQMGLYSKTCEPGAGVDL